MANKADNKALQKAAQTDVGVPFPMAQIRKDMDQMAKRQTESEKAVSGRQDRALDIVVNVLAWRDQCLEKDVKVMDISNDFRSNIAVLTKELAARKGGHKFIRLGKEKDGVRKASLTGHGANVVSICKGAIEQGIELEEGDTYLKIKDRVQEARRKAADPETRKLREAVENAREHFKEALKSAKVDVTRVNLLIGTLSELIDEWKAKDAESETTEPATDAGEESEETRKAA